MPKSARETPGMTKIKPAEDISREMPKDREVAKGIGKAPEHVKRMPSTKLLPNRIEPFMLRSQRTGSDVVTSFVDLHTRILEETKRGRASERGELISTRVIHLQHPSLVLLGLEARVLESPGEAHIRRH